jgi:hypothetical protein
MSEDPQTFINYLKPVLQKIEAIAQRQQAT